MQPRKAVWISIQNRAGSWAVLAGLALAINAFAQPEQWLEYHTGTEPKGYTWLGLSTNPPPGVALPALQPGAWYGRWTNAVEPAGGRWFCVDRSRKSGPCDRICFDANGNGRLNDDAPVTASRREEHMAWFAPIKLVYQGEDGPVSYHLVVRYYQFDQQPARLLAGSAGWYEGSLTLSGKKRRLQIFDNTVNGAFNDMGGSPGESDRIIVDGEDRHSRCLGRYLEVDNQLFQIEIARDGAFVKVKPAEGVQLGIVRVPETITRFTAIGQNGHFVRKPDQGEFKLPVGQYRVTEWESSRKDDKGATWTLSANNYRPTTDFKVKTDAVASLAVGEPVYAALQVTETRSDLAFSLRLVGSLGESVDILRGGDRPRAPQLKVEGAGFSAVRTFEYG